MRTTLIAALVLTAACNQTLPLSQPPRTGPRAPGDDRTMPTPAAPPAPTVSSIAGSFSSKKVDGKQDPNVLIAVDATRCLVSEKKYRETSLGEKVTCAWARP